MVLDVGTGPRSQLSASGPIQTWCRRQTLSSTLTQTSGSISLESAVAKAKAKAAAADKDVGVITSSGTGGGSFGSSHGVGTRPSRARRVAIT